MRTAPILAVLLLLSSPAAFAQGISISWGSGCWSDGIPLTNKTFACNTNAGAATFTVSFALQARQPEFRGVEVLVVGMSEAATMPDWWQMAPGECRDGSVTVSADFSTAPGVACADPWGGAALTELLYEDGAAAGASNRLRMTIHCALPSPVSLIASAEYYACKVRVDYQKSVGSGFCAGCPGKLLLGVYSVRAIGVGWYETLYCPLPDGNQCLTWQGSTLPCNPPTEIAGAGDECVQTVPVRNETWGRVKSLYR